MPLAPFQSADEFCARLWSNDVGRDMIGAKSARFLKRRLPPGGSLVGQSIDKIKVEL